VRLSLKGTRCETAKCAIEKRTAAPGERSQTKIPRRRVSDYGLQLREKQKLRRTYGVLEKQFRHYFEEAERRTGITGEVLLQFLERRLDNVIYRLSLTSSRPQARLLIGQGHFTVNGHVVNIPSYLAQVGDVVSVRESSRNVPPIAAAVARAGGRRLPSWMQTEADAMSGRVVALPARAEIDTQVQEGLVVEFYSR
jgi:small subunit ribosomal protein S4